VDSKLVTRDQPATALGVATMTTMNRINKLALRMLTPISGAALVLGLVSASPASAAPGHQNTDPYSTGCANDGYAFASHAVSGGTLRVFVSPTCGTNWIEYSGVAQYTYKYVSSAYGGTNQERDYTSWAYSMQTYAPGASNGIAIYYSGADGVGWSATCSATCTWYTA
jgi:hypothetical protein